VTPLEFIANEVFLESAILVAQDIYFDKTVYAIGIANMAHIGKTC
jgi:hypothetical protein